MCRFLNSSLSLCLSLSFSLNLKEQNQTREDAKKETEVNKVNK